MSEQRSGRQTIADISELKVKPSGSSALVKVADHLSGFVNVRSYGAKGDGVTDDTAAIQAVIAALGSTAATLIVPGPCVVGTDLTIPANLIVRFLGAGSFTGPGTVTYTGEPANAATLAATAVAESAKTAAEVARDAANATGKVYPDTAAGIAAVAEGEYFSVPSASSSESLILYREESGVAVAKKRYPALDDGDRLSLAALPVGDSGNLCDAAEVTTGFSLSSGVPTANADFFITDYMPVEPGTQYAFSPAAVAKPVAFYNAAQVYISSAAHTSTVTSPAGAAFARAAARLSEYSPAGYMFVEGAAVPSEYVPWRGHVPVRAKEKGAAGGVLALDASGLIPWESMPLEESVNLFDADTVTLGNVLSGGDGSLIAHAEFYVSDYMPVEELTQYAFSSAAANKVIAFYNALKVFISAGVHTSMVTSPAGAAFARASARIAERPPETYMFVEGAAVPTTYKRFRGLGFERLKNRDLAGGYAGLDSDGKLSPAVLPDAASSPLAGKKIAGLGDSITYGFIPRNAPGYPGQLNSYLTLVAAELGATALNYGISGSTLGDAGGGANSPFTQRYAAMSDDADLVIVMGGTNDVRKFVPLGVMGDTTDATFYGALDVLARGLLQKYRYTPAASVGKGKKIMFMTALRLGPTLDVNLPAFNEATIAVCKKYGIPVFDAYNLSTLTPELFRTLVGTEPGYTDTYNPFVPDGTHPSQEGHEIFAKAVAGFIRSLY
jgi:lysophospholipase L1-like esterase